MKKSKFVWLSFFYWLPILLQLPGICFFADMLLFTVLSDEALLLLYQTPIVGILISCTSSHNVVIAVELLLFVFGWFGVLLHYKRFHPSAKIYCVLFWGILLVYFICTQIPVLQMQEGGVLMVTSLLVTIAVLNYPCFIVLYGLSYKAWYQKEKPNLID